MSKSEDAVFEVVDGPAFQHSGTEPNLFADRNRWRIRKDVNTVKVVEARDGVPSIAVYDADLATKRLTFSHWE
jgi:hypothetical protein